MASPDVRVGFGQINREDFQPPVSIQVMEDSAMTRDQRVKHYIAQQFALGPLGDPHITAVRYRLRDEDWIDANDPFNDIAVDPISIFSSPEEFSALIYQYRKQLSEEDRSLIEQEELAQSEARERSMALYDQERVVFENRSSVTVFEPEAVQNQEAETKPA